MPSVSLPLFDAPEPAFYRGATARSRRTSASGAVAALQGRATKVARLRALWHEPHTLQEMAALTGYPLASICSLKKCLGADLVDVGEQAYRWADGQVTQRTVWQLLTDPTARD